MNDKEIKNYENVKKKILTTSEVIQKSFTNVLKKLKTEDYVVVENIRQKKTLVIQEIETFTNSKIRSSKNLKKAKTSKEVIALSRMFIKENIFFIMRFESKNITFPKIESIFNKTTTSTKKGFDIQITNQLMAAWRYILLDHIPFSFNEFLKLNSIIAKDQALEWGILRSGIVGISGTNFKPEIPTKNSIEKLFEDFYKSKNKYKAGAKLLIKLIKNQPFWDGNKRTAFLSVNKLFIEYGLGVLSIPEKLFNKFNILLNKYYNSSDFEKELTTFIVDNCIYNTMDKKLVI